jgi:dihydrofolate reductase
MIAAIGAKTRALGKNNYLLWRISDDLKRFKKITLGHPIIMGSKTYESIGHPLPKRTNIILSYNLTYQVEGAVVVHSIEEAFDIAKKENTDEVFIIGGGQVFQSALQFTNKLYLTLVHDDTPGDVYFPEYNQFSKKIFEEDHPTETPPYTYVELERSWASMSLVNNDFVCHSREGGNPGPSMEF